MGIFGDTFEKEKNEGFYERSETIGSTDERVNSATNNQGNVDQEETYEQMRENALPDKYAVVDFVIDNLLEAGRLENDEDIISVAISSLMSQPMHILKEILQELATELDKPLKPTQEGSINRMVKEEAPKIKKKSNLNWRTPSINS
jgi:hypothetical protein